jgi:TPR repeat protein
MLKKRSPRYTPFGDAAAKDQDQDQGEDVMKKTILHTLIRGASMFLPAQKEKGFEEGMAAYTRGDYATALKKWRPLAEAGDATAQYNLGVMYAEGRGVPQDDEEAAKWFRLAAEQGNAGAQNNLGVMYANGHGVPRDYREAENNFVLCFVLCFFLVVMVALLSGFKVGLIHQPLP